MYCAMGQLHVNISGRGRHDQKLLCEFDSTQSSGGQHANDVCNCTGRLHVALPWSGDLMLWSGDLMLSMLIQQLLALFTSEIF